MAWIFGSVAGGAEMSGSDFDLLVLGDVGFVDLVRAVRPVLYTTEEFDRRLKSGHAFVSELVTKQKMSVIGAERDVGRMVGDSTVLR